MTKIYLKLTLLSEVQKLELIEILNVHTEFNDWNLKVLSNKGCIYLCKFNDVMNGLNIGWKVSDKYGSRKLIGFEDFKKLFA